MRKAREPARPFSLYQSIGRRLPLEFRRNVQRQLGYAGQPIEAEPWLGLALVLVAVFLFGLVMSLTTYAFLAINDAFLLAAAFFGGAVLAVVVIYTHLSMQIEDRKNRIERILPDALRILSANIRAGMTPLVALRMTARPEFGPLEEEIHYATARSLGTEGITEIFRGMSERIPSPLFERSINLLAASLHSGGKLVDLLDRLAEDIRETQELKNDLNTATGLYVLFIIFTVVVGTPLLLAVSYHFSDLVSGLQGTTAAGGEQLGGLGLVISTPLSQNFIFLVSMTVITVTGLLASALIGAIREGNEVSGLKYAPFLIIASLLVFYFTRDVVLQFLKVA